MKVETTANSRSFIYSPIRHSAPSFSKPMASLTVQFVGLMKGGCKHLTEQLGMKLFTTPEAHVAWRPAWHLLPHVGRFCLLPVFGQILDIAGTARAKTISANVDQNDRHPTTDPRRL